jgi:predicted permease
VRYAARTARKSPGYTSIVVMTLALGIGANTAIFSFVNKILLEPYPYFESDRLVNASYTGPLPQGAIVSFQERIKQMELAGYESRGMNVSAEGSATRVTGAIITPNLLALLRTQPQMGRLFGLSDDLPGKDAFAIISDQLWHTRFGGDRNIIGRWIIVNDVPREIVAVMPPRFAFPTDATVLWISARKDPQKLWGDFGFWMIGRLKPGVTFEQARAEFKSVAPQVVAEFPWRMGNEYVPMFNIGSFQHDTNGAVRPILLTWLGAVGLLLLLACVNVANLTLARSSSRQREVAVRAALGASTRRIIRQLLTESAFLSVVGGALGLAIATAMLGLLKSVLPSYTPRIADVGIELPVVFFCFAISLLTGIAFGLVPAIRAASPNLEFSLKSGSRAAGETQSRLTLLSGLVTAEIALALILVCAAALLIKSLWVMTQTPIGLDREHLLTAFVAPSPGFCAKNADCLPFYEQLLDRARALPGVASAALSDGIPLWFTGRTVLAAEGRPEYSAEHPYPVWEYVVTADYLPTMKIRLVRGRNFSTTDRANSPGVVLVDRHLAEVFWPGQDPIGQHVKPSWMKEWRTVVGIVESVRPYNSPPDDYARGLSGQIYFPLAQGITGHPDQLNLALRLNGDPESVSRDLQSMMVGIAPSVPVTRVRTMETIVRQSLNAPRTNMWLFTAFAALALLLGLVGVFGTMSYSVAQRTREIGIRIALGADKPAIRAMILKHGSRVVAAGILFGIAGSLALTRFMSSLLQGVHPSDPGTLIAVAILVAIAAMLATVVPSRRASRIDPNTALRWE